MVRRALAAGALTAPVAYGVGLASAGPDAGLSALLGVVVVTANFAAHGLSLAWAAGISVTAVQGVALGGFVVRMGVITGLVFALDRATFFSPLVFGLAVISGTVALLAYEVQLVRSGLGQALEIPPDPPAVRAREVLRRREAAR